MFRKSIIITGGLLLLYQIGNPALFSLFGPKAAAIIDSLRREKLNRRDEALIEEGYYQNLMSVDRFNTQLWERYAKPPDWRPLGGTRGMRRRTGDFLGQELVPSLEMRAYGATHRINRWGMRDKDYEMAKPPHAFRVALLGSSMEMGLGVEDNETFEAILEERLNREAKGASYSKYEILNFAVYAYRPLDLLVVMERKVPPFQPDAIFYVAHPQDLRRIIFNLAERVEEGVSIPYAYLREVVARAKIGREIPKDAAIGRLKPFAPEMIFWSYQRIIKQCRDQGITPIWVLVPRVSVRVLKDENAQLIQLATEAGFTVLDLTDVFQGYDLEQLMAQTWDPHPNAAGHRLIADRLYKAIRDNQALRALLGLGSPTLG